jgi:hypothetical protein
LDAIVVWGRGKGGLEKGLGADLDGGLVVPVTGEFEDNPIVGNRFHGLMLVFYANQHSNASKPLASSTIYQGLPVRMKGAQ